MMSGPPNKTLSGAICEVLSILDARQKGTATRRHVAASKVATLALGNELPTDRPGRPRRPSLRPPRDVPRQRITQSAPGRIALLNAIAHIELNAVDLAMDMAIRFTETQRPLDFIMTGLALPMTRPGIS